MILYSSKYTKQKIDVAPVDFKVLTTHWIKERVRKQFSESYSNCRKKGWMPLFVTTIDWEGLNEGIHKDCSTLPPNYSYKLMAVGIG